MLKLVIGGCETAFPSFMDALQHFRNNAIFGHTKLARPYSEVRPKSGEKGPTEDILPTSRYKRN